MHRAPFRLDLTRIILVLLVLSIVLFEFPAAKHLIDSPYSGIETQNLSVRNVRSDGPSARSGIRRGDRIVSVDGTRVRNYNHLRAIIKDNVDRAPQKYTVLRAGRRIDVTVNYASVTGSFLYRHLAFLLVGFTFLLMGLLVFLRRTDILGVLFSLNCAMFAYFLTDRPVFSLPSFQLAGELINDAVILFVPAVFLHFFLVFPERAPGSKEPWKRLRIAYAIPTLLLLVSSVIAIQQFRGDTVQTDAVDAVLLFSTVYFLTYLILSLFIFGRSYRSSAVAQKEKLRIVITGTMVGIIPFVFTLVWRQVSPETAPVWDLLSVVALAFVSVSFAYAILKHGVIELNIVVRKSLAYAFLTGLIVAAYYALVNVLGGVITRELNLAPAYFSLISVLVLAMIFSPARDAVQSVVDRVFSRGDYNYSAEVIAFSRRLSKQLARRDVISCFMESIDDLLKVSFIGMYLRPERDELFKIEQSFGDISSLPETFQRRSHLGRYFNRYRKPLMVEYLDYSWSRRHLDESSRDFLSKHGAAVCLPVMSQDLVLGLVVLGPKRSGMLYSQTDSDLLARFSEHLGLVLENADLHEANVEQERLKKEVLVARDIQLSLLPKTPPEHPALQIVGRMASSVEVGGDYFDYFTLDDHRIGVAIGDCSGKGVPAAMLMSSIQAVFKNLVIKDRLTPGALVGELNDYLFDNAKTEQFATFFYGVIDVANSIFTFSNAGHCPTLLFRKQYVDRLGEGGMVLGVERNQVYQEGQVRLGPGDLLCLYTDGATEQSDGQDEQFGESRLIEFLEKRKHQPLEELQKSLFATILAYGSERQDDDITTIIARHVGV
ncbi:MAG: SpoIIE family protein phosphatase [bacterium]|nr:SpoIIE family protein phosphatase [bacterium]